MSQTAIRMSRGAALVTLLTAQYPSAAPAAETPRPPGSEIPVVELLPQRATASSAVRPGAKHIWVAERAPGASLHTLAWKRHGPFEAAAGNGYQFDSTGAWGADPQGGKTAPGDALIRFRNRSDTSSVLFCVEGATPPVKGARKWKSWAGEQPPRFLKVSILLKGKSVESEQDTSMPGADRNNEPVDVTVQQDTRQLAPVWLGENSFYADLTGEFKTERGWLSIAGVLSDDGTMLRSLCVSERVRTEEAGDAGSFLEERAWSFAAAHLPLTGEDEEDGLTYEAAGGEPHLKTPRDFDIQALEYSYLIRKETIEPKTWILKRDGLQRDPLVFSITVELQPQRDE